MELQNLLKRKWNSFARRIKKPYFYLSGMVGMRKRAHKVPANMMVLILTNLLGDSIYGLAYIDEIHKVYPNRKIVVIAARKNNFFIKNYKGIDKLIFSDDLDKKDRKFLTSLACSSQVSEEALKYNIINTTTCFYHACYNAQNPDSLFQLRSHILKIPANSCLTYPIFDQVDIKAIENFEADKERIVILNPYSNSLAGSSIVMFEKIAAYLDERNYRIFTNVIGNQIEIQGTQRLDCKIDELFSICKQIPLVISIRSGMLDAIVSSDVNLFVIYDQVDDKWMKIFSLHSWKCNGMIEEIQLNNDIEKGILVFKRFLKKVEGF